MKIAAQGSDSFVLVASLHAIVDDNDLPSSSCHPAISLTQILTWPVGPIPLMYKFRAASQRWNASVTTSAF